MAGHGFIARGDITRLSADALVYPEVIEPPSNEAATWRAPRGSKARSGVVHDVGTGLSFLHGVSGVG